MVRKTLVRRLDALIAAAGVARDARHAFVAQMAASDSASFDNGVKATYDLHILRNALIDDLASEHITTPRKSPSPSGPEEKSP